jgi:uroporphyrinogen decarboxylase
VLREKYDILTIARTPDLCAQVSLLPIEQYGVDAAVMYTDIVLPLPGMGLTTEIDPEIGPLIRNPVRTMQDVAALHVREAAESTPFVADAIGFVRARLADKQALIAIAGAPFTLALYMIEGRPSRDYHVAKAFMHEQPAAWHALLHKISQVLAHYVRAEAAAGADAIQLFDSSIGVLGPQDYKKFVLPYSQHVLEAIKDTGVASIHFGVANASLLELMAQAGGDVLGVDWRTDLDVAWDKVDSTLHGIQGNLDPTLLLAPWEMVRPAALDIFRRVGGRPGHIFNLGHAIHPATDPDLLRRLVDLVHLEGQALPLA